MRAPSSLFARLTGLIAFVLLVAAVLLGHAAWIYARVAADDAYDRLLVGAALQIAESVAAEQGRVTVDPPNSAFETLGMAADDRIFYRVSDPGGAVLTGQADLASATRFRPQREPVISDGTYRGFAIRIVSLGRFVTGPDVSGWVEVTVAQTLHARLMLTRDLTEKALILVIGMSILALAGVVFAVRRALRPLEQVEALLKSRDPHDLSPVAIATPREIRPLIDAINHFLGRLAKRIGGIERFIADAAHQIRTPLTALTAQVDLLSVENSAVRRSKQINRVKERTEQLGRLTNQLLNHAMVNHRREVVRPELIDLVPLARAVLAETVPLSLERDIEVRFESSAPSMPVMGDRVSMREALINVVHNAVCHGAPNELGMMLTKQDSWCEVLIEDDGPGIAREFWTEALKPFRRIGGEDGAERQGSGLGLSIVADVMAAHGGEIAAVTRPSGRFAIVLRFPAHQEKLPSREHNDAQA
ncbi:MAG: sensor histidine kinase [Proteobacteria bacterium]|nr:sensor histidine kinase [Pseudomonadota bacterium]